MDDTYRVEITRRNRHVATHVAYALEEARALARRLRTEYPEAYYQIRVLHPAPAGAGPGFLIPMRPCPKCGRPHAGREC